MRRPWSMFDKEKVLTAIKGSFGIVSTIAKVLDGCSWHTAWDYVMHWEETRAAYADENERALDLSESKMLKMVNQEDGPMIRFHLATKGKDRGYTERHEVSGPNAGPIDVRQVDDLRGKLAKRFEQLAAGGDSGADDATPAQKGGR